MAAERVLNGLEQPGFVVGRNVAIKYQFAQGNNEHLPYLAAELIALPAAVLVAYGSPAAVAAKQASHDPSDRLYRRL